MERLYRCLIFFGSLELSSLFSNLGRVLFCIVFSSVTFSWWCFCAWALLLACLVSSLPGIAALTLLPCQGPAQLRRWQSGNTLMAPVCLPSFLVSAMLTSLPRGTLPLSLHKWNRVSLLALPVWFSPIFGMAVLTLLPPRVWLGPLWAEQGCTCHTSLVLSLLGCSALTSLPHNGLTSSVSSWAEQAHAYSLSPSGFVLSEVVQHSPAIPLPYQVLARSLCGWCRPHFLAMLVWFPPLLGGAMLILLLHRCLSQSC